MRIGIDARELGGRATGVGRYLGGLLREWAAAGRTRDHDFVLYAPQPIALSLDARRFATRAARPGLGGVGPPPARVFAGPPPLRDADDPWIRRHVVGTDRSAARGRAGSSRRVVRPRLHRAAAPGDPHRRRDP